MKREDEFIGFGSMRIWLAVLAGLVGVCVLVFYGIGFVRSHQSLMSRVYRNGEFTMGAKTPWGQTPDEVWANISWGAGEKTTTDLYNARNEAAKKKADGSYGIVSFDNRRYRESEWTLRAVYHISGEDRLVSGAFVSVEKPLEEVRREAAAFVKSASRLPVTAETPEAAALAALADETFTDGAFVYRAGKTRMEIAIVSRLDSLSPSGRSGTLEVRVYGE